jgi:hypothetical protein
MGDFNRSRPPKAYHCWSGGVDYGSTGINLFKLNRKINQSVLACYCGEDRQSGGGILLLLDKERAAIAMKFPGRAIVRRKSGAPLNELDIWPPPPKPEG